MEDGALEDGEEEVDGYVGVPGLVGDVLRAARRRDTLGGHGACGCVDARRSELV